MDMFGIVRYVPVRGFQQQRGKLSAVKMWPCLMKHRGGGGDQRRRHAGAGHRRIPAPRIGRDDIDPGCHQEAVADLRRVKTLTILPAGADIAGLIAGDPFGYGIPVADNQHLTIQNQLPLRVGGGGPLVRAGTVICVVIASRLDQDLVRAKRLAPTSSLQPHAIKAVHTMPGVIEVVAAIANLHQPRLQPVIAEIGGTDIHCDRTKVTPPGRCRAGKIETIAPF